MTTNRQRDPSPQLNVNTSINKPSARILNRKRPVSIATENRVRFTRHWEMPNHRTYSIKCIEKLIRKYVKPDMLSIDPFANQSRIAKITNDLNPDYGTDYNMDAVDFLKMFDSNSVDAVLYDPPYSLRQVVECYKSVGKEVTMETTQSNWRTRHIDEISRIVKPFGIAICFGWNSSGVGIKRGFELIEVVLVAHGGSHNDTIITVERKIQSKLFV